MTQQTDVKRGTQLTVYLDDRPGTLGVLADLLGRNRVNLFGLSVTATAEGHGCARLVVDDTEKARQLIEDAGELVAAGEVLLLRADNAPGSFGRILQRLADAQVNVEYAYSIGGPGDGKAIVLRPSDIDTALAALGA